jgi:hypothetical protein
VRRYPKRVSRPKLAVKCDPNDRGDPFVRANSIADRTIFGRVIGSATP